MAREGGSCPAQPVQPQLDIPDGQRRTALEPVGKGRQHHQTGPLCPLPSRGHDRGRLVPRTLRRDQLCPRLVGQITVLDVAQRVSLGQALPCLRKQPAAYECLHDPEPRA